MPMLSGLWSGVSNCAATTSTAQRTAPAIVSSERAGMRSPYRRRPGVREQVGVVS